MMDRGKVLALQGGGHGTRLRLAPLVEGDVFVALLAMLGIPGSFAVADEADSGDGH
ncbi:hypothetical protein GCM10027046_24390 [Uliginosibacterium flavum]